MTRPAVTQPLNPGEIFLGANRYHLAPGSVVQRTKMTVIAPAIRTGNAVHADDQIASSVIWDDLTGGIGVLNMDEQQSPDRFSDSSLNTLINGYWTLPPKVHQVTMPASWSSPATFGGAVVHKNYLYTTIGAVPIRVSNTDTPLIEYYDSVGLAWVTTGGTLLILSSTTSGVANPVQWKGNIWFALGKGTTASSLWRYNVAAQTFSVVVDGAAAGVPAARLAVFDEDLYILCDDGRVVSTDDNATTINLVARGSIDSFVGLTGLAIHRNLSNDPAPIVATESRLLMHDFFAGKFYEMGIAFPDGNVNNGAGLAVWDGDVWFGRGSNLNQVTSGSRVVRGPNTGDGLVKESQGSILDIDPGLDNYLVYCIAGGQTYRTSSVMAYNRKGHHVLAKVVVAAQTAATDAFTRADNAATMAGTGKNWVEGPGTWGIASNRAYCSASAGTVNRSVATPGFLGGTTAGNNQSAQVTLSTNATGAQLVFRSDRSNSYFALETYASGYQMVEVLNSSRTVLQKIPMSTANGDVLRVDAYGASYTAYVNGAVVSQGTLTFYPIRTAAGIGTVSSTTPRFDDFSLTILTEPTNLVKYMPSGQTDKAGLLFFTGGAPTLNTSTTLNYIKLFDTTDNPNQFIANDFESSGSVTLPWFDAGLADVSKTGFNVQIRTLNCSATETVTVSYAVDDSTSFTQCYSLAGFAATVTTNGLTTLYLDADRLGTAFYKIRFKVDLASGASTTSPVVIFLKLRYLREFDILYSYTCTLDLTGNQPDGQTPNSAIATLDALVGTRLLTQLAYHSGKTTDTKDVFFSTYAGPTGSANDRGGLARVTLVEVTPQS